MFCNQETCSNFNLQGDVLIIRIIFSLEHAEKIYLDFCKNKKNKNIWLLHCTFVGSVCCCVKSSTLKYFSFNLMVIKMLD